MNTRQLQGFSLVEFLLVIILVSILFLTATPKFESAGIASKVAQTRMDLAYLESGLQAYFSDWRGYPDDHDSDDGFAQGLNTLTSPIPYLSEFRRDPFSDGTFPGLGPLAYEGGSGCPPGLGATSSGWPNQNGVNCIHSYLLIGLGPDRSDSTLGNDAWPYENDSPDPFIRLRTYNPTNGTESQGDIYRMIGAFAEGNFWLDDTIIGGPQSLKTSREGE